MKTLQEQQQTNKDNRRARDLQIENTRIARDIKLEKDRKREEEEQRERSKGRYKQTKTDRQLELENNKVKLLEAEARTLKMIADVQEFQRQSQI